LIRSEKDFKGSPLTVEDILHYQKIIVALAETDRLMKDIDELIWWEKKADELSTDIRNYAPSYGCLLSQA
jgi:hypothetical protein